MLGTMAVEVVLLLGFLAVWEVVVAGGSGGWRVLSVLLAAAAMGVQSEVGRRTRIGISTTYFTGTLTGVLSALASGNPAGVSVQSAAGLLALVAGAACGAVLAVTADPYAPLPAVGAALAAWGMLWRTWPLPEERGATGG